jgi:hypothetical protein
MWNGGCGVPSRPNLLRASISVDIQGLAYKEITHLKRTSVGTVSSRVHRGRCQLRELLRDTARDRGYSNVPRLPAASAG